MRTQRSAAPIFCAGLFALLLAWGTACSSAITGPSPRTMRIFSTTVVNDHFHMVTIDQTDIQDPPSLGLSESTTASRDHSHSLALSELHLSTVNEGTPVTLTTGVSEVGGAHAHDVTIRKWF